MTAARRSETKDILDAYEGKTAVVTGCASGIGAAVARRLIDAGARVFGLDKNEPEGKFEQFISVDLAAEPSIRAAAAALPGEIWFMFNCAGLSSGAADPATVATVNFLGLRELVEAVSPRIPRGGAVVSTSSGAGLRYRESIDEVLGLVRTASFTAGRGWLEDHADYVREHGGYRLSKEALVLYTMDHCWPLGNRGVRINAVGPGITETPMLKDSLRAVGPERLPAAPQPLGRRSTADEQANVLLFLNSEWASYVNGQTIWSDAGSLSARLSDAGLQ
jgi:NAD(P)-dependent dehydrogenase (short-subunit alcohol dehydrogenase family)